MQQTIISENKCVINERIHGFSKGDLTVISRLRNLGVPKNLYWAGFRVCQFTSAEEHKASCEEAEGKIIAWGMEKWGLPEEATLRVLNGKSSLVQETENMISSRSA